MAQTRRVLAAVSLLALAAGKVAAQTPEEAKPTEPPVQLPLPEVPLPEYGPLGNAARSDLPSVRVIDRPTIASPDRWRIGWPAWDRYGRQAPSDPLLMNASGGDSPFTLGNPLNPYDRNVLKGDYPVLGNDIFLNLSATSDTFIAYRRNPTPSGVSANNPGSFDTFADGRQFAFNQNVFVTADVFRGYTAYRPVDWLVRVTGAFNFNYLELEELNGVNVSPTAGDTRHDTFATIQEAFFEYHLGDTSSTFDIAALKIGRQLFVSDFRGFIFNDITDGVRVFGNAMSNQVQYNLAFFQQPEKDTNSGLSELNWRDQQVAVASVFIQDFLTPGYTTQFSFHWNHDRSDERYDRNGFVVRPDLIGSANLRDLDVYYLGWASDGHVGRVNVSHAAYYAFGRDSGNPLAGRPVDISAFMGALELSMDFDWLRPKVSFLYASGDGDPTDGTGGGFDGIFDDPSFAGGASSFYQNQGIRLFGVGLTQARSFYTSLKASKAEGQANFVNPGTMLFNLGLDAEITPTWRASVNANAIWFTDTSSVEYLTNQNGISRQIGGEVNVLTQYRPLLNNNVILTVGASAFFPAKGFNAIYDQGKTLFNVFTGITLTY